MLTRPYHRLRPISTVLPLRSIPSTPCRRGVSYLLKRPPKESESNTTQDNPILRRYYEEEKAAKDAVKRHNAGKAKDDDMSLEDAQSKLREPPPELGSLSSDSLINSRLTKQDEVEIKKGSILEQIVPATRLAALDPKPMQRRRWERKMVIREVQRRGRLSKAQILKRTERALMARSPYLKTSMKKLNPLANQIAGKTVEEAIVQMRFSRKKVAVDVRQQLEAARDQAIVERGMGLGQVDQANKGMPRIVRLKDGTRHKIQDRTGIYVDQAWVGKGPYGHDRNPRARGRIDRLSLPQTSISLVLKEEHARIREFQERQERAAKKKIWTPLPDRPITGQRQYYCW